MRYETISLGREIIPQNDLWYSKHKSRSKKPGKWFVMLNERHGYGVKRKRVLVGLTRDEAIGYVKLMESIKNETR